jgi:hypothetical protein
MFMVMKKLKTPYAIDAINVIRVENFVNIIHVFIEYPTMKNANIAINCSKMIDV